MAAVRAHGIQVLRQTQQANSGAENQNVSGGILIRASAAYWRDCGCDVAAAAADAVATAAAAAQCC